MDLLAGYGSATDDEDDNLRPSHISQLSSFGVAATAAPAIDDRSAGTTAQPRSSLLASLPVPKAVVATSSAVKPPVSVNTAAALPAGFFDNPAETQPSSNSSKQPPAGIPSNFFDSAPTEAARDDDPTSDVGPAVRPPPAAVADLPQPGDTALWSRLPAPKAAAGKRKVLFRPQINLELLAASDSDEDDLAAPAAKKAKPAAGAGTKPSILSFLPAPKHAPAGPKASGARLVTDEQSNEAMAAARNRNQQHEHAATAPAGPAVDSNEAYRVRPAAAAEDSGYGHDDSSSYDYQQQYAQQYEQYYSTEAAAGSTYYHNEYSYNAPTATAARGATTTVAGGSSGGYVAPEEALLQEALQAEAAKAARRNAGAGSSQLLMPDIKFKEVKADAIKYVDPSQREAAQGMRAALGSDYVAKLRAEAAPHVGSRLARSKHQIGTLFANAKLRELEILENRASGMKSKAETAGKYGWR